jgi:transposase
MVRPSTKKRGVTMSTIPTSVTEEQFNEHIRPHLSTAKRGYECKIPLYKVFNYMLYRLHTGCQWAQLPIAPDPEHPEKRTELASRVPPFSQVEPRWEPEKVWQAAF